MHRVCLIYIGTYVYEPFLAPRIYYIKVKFNDYDRYVICLVKYQQEQ